MPGIFPKFRLPFLRKLSLQFSEEKLKKDISEIGLDDNRNGLVLLQLILNASTNLKDFILPFTGTVKVIPLDFKYLQLPGTISVLELTMKLKNKELEVLLRHQLPKLSHLILHVLEIPFEDDLLFKVLERFQKTLQTFELRGLISDGRPEPLTHLRFPLMEKLTEMHICSTECELGPGNVSALQSCFPDLRVIKLLDQTEARLAKWTRNSRFGNVEQLFVSVVNEQLAEEHDEYNISPGPDVMTQLQQTFPNVWYLALNVNISDLTSLKSVFQNMVQLKSLTINVFGNGTVLDTSSDLVDSIFLGLPLRLVVTLKESESMELLDNGTISIKGGSEPSIRNLSGIQS